MQAPALSVFSAASELVVTVAVFYVFYRAYARNDWRGGLLAIVLAFEVLVNVTYMSYRFILPHPGTTDGLGWLRAGHGILSLLMLVALFAYAWLARDAYREGRNMLREAPRGMWSFIGLWTLSVASGEVLFVLQYMV